MWIMDVSRITVSPNYIFQLPETDDEGSAPAALRDAVSFSTPYLLPDEEAEVVLDDTINLIGADYTAAFSVHGGLNENRVYQLLGLM